MLQSLSISVSCPLLHCLRAEHKLWMLIKKERNSVSGINSEQVTQNVLVCGRVQVSGQWLGQAHLELGTFWVSGFHVRRRANALQLQRSWPLAPAQANGNTTPRIPSLSSLGSIFKVLLNVCRHLSLSPFLHGSLCFVL